MSSFVLNNLKWKNCSIPEDLFKKPSKELWTNWNVKLEHTEQWSLNEYRIKTLAWRKMRNDTQILKILHGNIRRELENGINKWRICKLTNENIREKKLVEITNLSKNHHFIAITWLTWLSENCGIFFIVWVAFENSEHEKRWFVKLKLKINVNISVYFQVCIPAALLCDGWENCPESADESEEICNMQNRRTPPPSNKNTIFIVVFVAVVIICLIAYTNVRRTQICRTKLPGSGNEPKDDQAMDPLSPASHKPTHAKIAAVSENVRMNTLNSRTTVANSYDRNNITGASSSTTNGSIGYINPPPSPETTRANSHRPYNRHYKKVNKPPPPSPAETTDFCDESDEYRAHSRMRSPLSCEPHDYRTNILRTASNGTGSINSNSLRKARYCYDREPCPPPPTPRSHYHSHSDGHQAPESSCPGSPIRSISISSSTYFSPPPPPSPQLKNWNGSANNHMYLKKEFLIYSETRK